jgi:hypothetical protein
LVHTPPARRRRREPVSTAPRRSDRLAAKSVFRDPNPEKQAKRILVHKWEGKPADAVSSTPDNTIAEKFHVPDFKWKAMDELLRYRGLHADAAVGLMC